MHSTHMHDTHVHVHTQQALDWCIEAAALLTDHDVIAANPADIDAEYIKQELDQFAAECPPLSEEELQQLTELMESTENHWIKDNAFFACTRVLEITERFRYYQKVLEGMVAEKRKLENIHGTVAVVQSTYSSKVVHLTTGLATDSKILCQNSGLCWHLD